MELGGNDMFGAAKMGGKEEKPPISIVMLRCEGVNKEVNNLNLFLKRKLLKIAQL